MDTSTIQGASEMASSFWTSPLMLALGGIAVFITLGTVVITLGLAYLKKPSIRLEYVTENVDGSLVLTLNIYNDPIYLPLFTHLNIGRKGSKNFVSFTLYGTKKEERYVTYLASSTTEMIITGSCSLCQRLPTLGYVVQSPVSKTQ